MNNTLPLCALCGSHHMFGTQCNGVTHTMNNSMPFCTHCACHHVPNTPCVMFTNSTNAISISDNTLASLHIRLHDDQLKLLAQYVADELVGLKGNLNDK